MPGTPSHPCSEAQREFIVACREQVKSRGKAFFYNHDWRMILPRGGRYSSLQKNVHCDSFYVRPVASWVPHLLFEDFKPTCPHCQCKDQINMNKCRWINSPKTLCGLKDYRYLDTMLCKCDRCNKSFAGYHKDSMKHDMDGHEGYFNLHFSGRFAVDEELFSFIVACNELPVPRIYRLLEHMAVDTHLNCYQLYLHAAKENKLKMARPDVADHDRLQLTLNFEETQHPNQLSLVQRQLRSLKSWMRSKRLSLQSLRARCNDNVCFKKMTQIKKNRNHEVTTDLLPSVGPKKLRELLQSGVTNARELVNCNDIPRAFRTTVHTIQTFEGWKLKARKLFEARDKAVADCEQEIEELERLIGETEEQVAREKELRAQDEALQSEDEMDTDDLPPLFSGMDEQKGYNAKILSNGRTDQILNTDFLNREQCQQSKMMGKGIEILSLDFSYELPPKLDAYVGVGNSFKPYKCMAHAHNQDNQTVYWKMCQNTESIGEIEPGLRKMEERNPLETKVMYVDKCCSWRKKLKEIFPNALVKLDVLHWMKRFEEAFFDSKSEEAAMFRGLLRRISFITDDQEFQRARGVVKAKLIKRKKLNPDQEPPLKLVMAEARTQVPSKEEHARLFMALFKFVQDTDSHVERMKLMRDPNDKSELPKPFFKPMNTQLPSGSRRNPRTVAMLWEEQLSHITKGCLEDVPGICLHRQNPNNNKTFCCRGSSSDETDNLHLDALTGKHLGPGRFDRTVSTFFEIGNHRGTRDCGARNVVSRRQIMFRIRRDLV